MLPAGTYRSALCGVVSVLQEASLDDLEVAIDRLRQADREPLPSSSKVCEIYYVLREAVRVAYSTEGC